MDERTQRFLRIANEQSAKTTQGKLKIFLGMVAGVGKTFAMLSAAHDLKKNGVDVVVGYVETHGRKDTAERLGGLPLVPRTTFEYKGKHFEEMDLPAILARKPQIVLVDELAHTNVPGSKHTKRYQDVQEILKNGIDVYTTLNVQHLESCAATVLEITNGPVQETLPDSIIDESDEIILIDIAPEQVIERLKEGKIYPEEKVGKSLENFFTQSNLSALREMVLRVLADRVNSDLRDFQVLRGVPQIWKTGHRLLVPLHHTREGEYLIRMARRMASGLNAYWVAGRIESKRPLTPEEQNQLNRNTNLARQLGAEVVVVNDENVGEGLMRLARSHQVTQIIMERPRISAFNVFMQWSVLRHVITQLEEVDIIFIGTPKTSRFDLPVMIRTPFADWSWKTFGYSMLVMVAVTVFCLLTLNEKEYQAAGMIYLILLNLCALFTPWVVIVATTLMTGMLWNFLFIPPRLTFHVSSLADTLILLSFCFAALITGFLTSKIRKKEDHLRYNDERLSTLYFLTKNIFEIRGPQKMARLLVDKILDLFQVQAGVFFPSLSDDKSLDTFVIGNLDPREKEFHVANWVFMNHRTAGRFTDTLASVSGMYIPLMSGSGCYGVLGIVSPEQVTLSSAQILMLEDMARHLAIGIEREMLNENVRKSQIREATEKVYQTLLSSVSHELKTPLAAINGAASSMLDDLIVKNPTAVKSLAEQIVMGAGRMQFLVQNLLDMSRIEAGKMSLKFEPYDIRDLVSSVLDHIDTYYPKRQFDIRYRPEQIPLVSIDAPLLGQALKNIVQNACQYGPEQAPIHIHVSCDAKHRVLISIRDEGPGFPIENPDLVFQKFFRANSSIPGGTGLGLTIAKAIIEMHNGDIQASNASEGGAMVLIHLPLGPSGA